LPINQDTESALLFEDANVKTIADTYTNKVNPEAENLCLNQQSRYLLSADGQSSGCQPSLENLPCRQAGTPSQGLNITLTKPDISKKL